MGGYRKIYQDLVRGLAKADIASAAANLGLHLNDWGEAEVPFLGHKYWVSQKGVGRSGGERILASGRKAWRWGERGWFVWFDPTIKNKVDINNSRTKI